MRLKSIFIALSLMLTACGKDDQKDNLLSAQAQEPESIPLEDYNGPSAPELKEAKALAEAMGFTFSYVFVRTSSPITSEGFNIPALAYCKISSPFRQIVAQPNEVTAKLTVADWLLVFAHEFGHCSLGQEHKEKGLMKADMEILDDLANVFVTLKNFNDEYHLKLNFAPLVAYWKANAKAPMNFTAAEYELVRGLLDADPASYHVVEETVLQYWVIVVVFPKTVYSEFTESEVNTLDEVMALALSGSCAEYEAANYQPALAKAGYPNASLACNKDGKSAEVKVSYEVLPSGTKARITFKFRFTDENTENP